jgi:outer membrane protein TolC
MSHQLSCEEKKVLLLTYQNATEAYSRTVTHMTKGVAVLFGEYEFLNQKVKAAREASVEARERLSRHVAEHHC